MAITSILLRYLGILFFTATIALPLRKLLGSNKLKTTPTFPQVSGECFRDHVLVYDEDIVALNDLVIAWLKHSQFKS